MNPSHPRCNPSEVEQKSSLDCWAIVLVQFQRVIPGTLQFQLEILQEIEIPSRGFEFDVVKRWAGGIMHHVTNVLASPVAVSDHCYN